MRIDKSLFFKIIGVNLLIANAFLLIGFNFLLISTLFSAITFFVIPGILGLMCLKIRGGTLWELGFLAAGLGIAFLEFGGLAVNEIGLFLKIAKPLSTFPLLAGFDLILLSLVALSWTRNQTLRIRIRRIKPNLKRSIPYLFPLLFPVLSTIGAFSLNNGGSNFWVMVLLFLIAAFVIRLVALYKYIPENLYPYTIYMTALALLFSTSLRSWFITGHDIQREYYVFKLTNIHNFWSMDFYKDAYNACMSITILPTVIVRLFQIRDIYVFKIVFQLLFAICPVIVFFTLLKYTSRIQAFLSSFLFMSFPTFLNDMPMLTRQEIAFIFFGLTIYILLISKLRLRVRNVLFIIFGASIIISHYSTNYVAIAMFASLLIFEAIRHMGFAEKYISNFAAKKGEIWDSKFYNSPYLNFYLLGLLLILTFFWNAQVTKTAGNVGSVTAKIIQGIFIPSKDDNRSQDVSYSLFFGSKLSPDQILSNYIKQGIKTEDSRNDGPRFDVTQYSKYKSYMLDAATMPLTFFGNTLTKVKIPVFKLNSLSRSLAAAFLQLGVFIGVAGILILKIKKSYDAQYIVLCLTAISLLVASIILPELSAEYGLLRLFQQLLFVLSLPIVSSLIMIFSFLGNSKKVYITGFVFILFFLTLSGFFSHLTGGFYPQMTLDNAGLYYDAYYVKRDDLVSADWLSRNKIKNAPVQSDLSGSIKLFTYGDIAATNNYLPPFLLKNSYAYVDDDTKSYINVSINGDTVYLNSPEKFIASEKNLIYNNGSTKIYK
ncbi:MAG TPA: DUF2206 domain-containing protein [Patescibacteria group bacterium]|nr:DUF2206 domain-containing protein [Patescibacteria group bacterium]